MRLKKLYYTIKSNNIIKKIIKSNEKIFSKTHTVFLNNDLEDVAKISFIAPKKLGNAVKRNYAKRLLRACFTEIVGEEVFLKKSLVIIATNKIFSQSFLQLKKEMIFNISKINASD